MHHHPLMQSHTLLSTPHITPHILHANYAAKHDDDLTNTFVGRELDYFSQAGFDLDKINLRRNAPVAQLYEEAVRYEGAVISSSGALIKDKRIVYVVSYYKWNLLRCKNDTASAADPARATALDVRARQKTKQIPRG